MRSSSITEAMLRFLLLGLLMVGGGFLGTTSVIGATRVQAGSDVVLVAERRLHLAYIVEDTDIMVKKTCQCVPRRHCINQSMIQLTGGKCSYPFTCCEITLPNFDFDKY